MIFSPATIFRVSLPKRLKKNWDWLWLVRLWCLLNNTLQNSHCACPTRTLTNLFTYVNCYQIDLNLSMHVCFFKLAILYNVSQVVLQLVLEKNRIIIVTRRIRFFLLFSYITCHIFYYNIHIGTVKAKMIYLLKCEIKTCTCKITVNCTASNLCTVGSTYIYDTVYQGENFHIVIHSECGCSPF